jgi:uncharacterized repeat protein (TIGR01451 family)
MFSAGPGRYMLPVYNPGTADLEAFAVWNGGSSVNIFLANHAVASETDFDEFGAQRTVALMASGFSLNGAQIMIIDSAHPSPTWTALTQSSVTISGYGVAFIRTAPPTVPAFSLTSTHVGGFVGPQSGMYTLTVTNTGSVATSGTITLTDSLPAGLTPSSIAGNGWTCALTTLACTTDAVLQPGNNTSVSLTVNVAFNAAANVANQADVSGGGALSATIADATMLPRSCAVITHGTSVTVADVQRLINESLGVASATDDLNLDGRVNVVDIQIGINAALGLGCAATWMPPQ